MLDSGTPGITVSPTLWWWRSNREGDQAEIYLEDDPNCTFVLTDTPLTKDLRPSLRTPSFLNPQIVASFRTKRGACNLSGEGGT